MSTHWVTVKVCVRPIESRPAWVHPRDRFEAKPTIQTFAINARVICDTPMSIVRCATTVCLHTERNQPETTRDFGLAINTGDSEESLTSAVQCRQEIYARFKIALQLIVPWVGYALPCDLQSSLCLSQGSKSSCHDLWASEASHAVTRSHLGGGNQYE
jgi:hypothetical protein